MTSSATSARGCSGRRVRRKMTSPRSREWSSAVALGVHLSVTASALNKPSSSSSSSSSSRLLHLGSAVALGVLLVHCVSLE